MLLLVAVVAIAVVVVVVVQEAAFCKPFAAINLLSARRVSSREKAVPNKSVLIARDIRLDDRNL